MIQALFQLQLKKNLNLMVSIVITDCRILKKVQYWGGFKWHNIHTKFHEDSSSGSNVERENTAW
jgi:hypothetical protein